MNKEGQKSTPGSIQVTSIGTTTKLILCHNTPIYYTYILEVESHVLLSALGPVHRHIHGRLVDARVRRQLTKGLQVACLWCDWVRVEREKWLGVEGHEVSVGGRNKMKRLANGLGDCIKTVAADHETASSVYIQQTKGRQLKWPRTSSVVYLWMTSALSGWNSLSPINTMSPCSANEQWKRVRKRLRDMLLYIIRWRYVRGNNSRTIAALLSFHSPYWSTLFFSWFL